MPEALRTAAPHQTSPHQDRYDTPVPPTIAEIIRLGQILTQYGHHLLQQIEPPIRWFGFATIAQFFGTTTLTHIAARIIRGLMRLQALEDLLFHRAQSGRDLVVLAPRASHPRALRTAQQQAPKTPKPPEPPLTPLTLPTMDDIRAEVSRCSIGQTIAAICLDLGISPSLCTGPFWNRLFNAMQAYRGSLATVVTEFRRREKRVGALDWGALKFPGPQRTRDRIRAALGFFIGEPLPPEPAAIAGPS